MSACILVTLQKASNMHHLMHCSYCTPKAPEEQPISTLGLFYYLNAGEEDPQRSCFVNDLTEISNTEVHRRIPGNLALMYILLG